MPSLICFWHPKREYVRDRTLVDACPDCSRPYGYPLATPPTHIGEFRIVRALSRGFYGAIYEAERPRLGQRVALKVIPVDTYRFFGKNFEEECRVHADVARDTSHLVSIDDFIETPVKFGDAPELACHVAVLQYVDGVTLAELLDDPAALPTVTVAQIAVDLLRLLAELERKQRFHNDLHAGNIQIRRLRPEAYRATAIDPAIIAIAVDLGSITDASRSDEEQQTGDLRQVAHHLLGMANILLAQPGAGTDADYRLALGLADVAEYLSPDAANMRAPEFEQYCRHIEDSLSSALSPWQEPPGAGLARFSESYNAQTLRSWFIPKLMVDPEGWRAEVQVAGPQIITGIRGCGKTMLLRSLQFHVRASQYEESALNGGAVSGGYADDFVGLYVSSSRLLDRLGSPGVNSSIHEPYARLFLAYCREAFRAVRHMREMPGLAATVSPHAFRRLADIVESHVENAILPEVISDLALERWIHSMQTSLDRGEAAHRLSTNAAVAFKALAAAIIECSSAWRHVRVYYLLDDVSTRLLNEAAIRDLVSTLLFNDETCAFKITTEAQTLEFVIKSPGLVEKARAGRDYDTFDLGARIIEQLSRRGRSGQRFVSMVLDQRARNYSQHPEHEPADIVGDTSLVSIARALLDRSGARIDSDGEGGYTGYWGISALAAICVGDIGDVIAIYDMILSRAGRVDVVPVDPQLQSRCFREHASKRLYHLSRRGGHLKAHAVGFALAARDLLVDSARNETGTRNRLRQYARIYVNVAEADEQVMKALRELMDAGVFVLEGGPDSPRSKNRDADPVTQFALTYRLLFGVTAGIGLARSDRFELAGERLAEWVAHPEESRRILTEGLLGRRRLATGGGSSSNGGSAMGEPTSKRGRTQAFALLGDVPEAMQFAYSPDRSPIALVSELTLEQLALRDCAGLIVGRGFEERSLVSVSRLAGAFSPSEATLVRYAIEGYGAQVEDVVEGMSNRVLSMKDAGDGSFVLPLPHGQTVVDVTGLSKPYVFDAVRRLFARDGSVVVAYTAAAEYVPLESEVRSILEANRESNVYDLLDALGRVFAGETGPYAFVNLLATDSDDSRRRTLLASASAKHERLLALLEERDFDQLELLAPAGESPRRRLARIAADVATRDRAAAHVTPVDPLDLTSAIGVIYQAHEWFYRHQGFEVEVALTGSKLNAVAAAVVAARRRFASAWYVRPNTFDVDRFTRGAKRTRVFLIEEPPTLDVQVDGGLFAGSP